MSRARMVSERAGLFFGGLTGLALLGLIASAVGCSSPRGVSGESTDLFLVELWTDAGLVEFGRPVAITDREGYDNQPSFSREGDSVLFVSREGKSADIQRYDLESEAVEGVTSSGDREYSPQPLPTGDGFSAIRTDRNARQRIWKYDASGEHGEPLFTAVEIPFLYYAWADEGTVVAVLEPRRGAKSLYVGDVAAGEVRPVLDHVGRSVQPVPGRRAVSFVHKESAADWWVKLFDVETGEVLPVARTLQGVEDHAWTPGGVLVMARGSELFFLVPGGEWNWEPVADFSGEGLTNITRLAVRPSGDAIVLVAEHKRD